MNCTCLTTWVNDFHSRCLYVIGQQIYKSHDNADVVCPEYMHTKHTSIYWFISQRCVHTPWPLENKNLFYCSKSLEYSAIISTKANCCLVINIIQNIIFCFTDDRQSYKFEMMRGLWDWMSALNNIHYKIPVHSNCALNRVLGDISKIY